ncbi:MAG: ArsC family reductase [Rickettsiales bacterium]|nr:ArsC family reductase [Rickettsiales bacterium]
MYAIPNCDTVKKARKWLADNDISYAFHDYKKQGVDEDALREAVKTFGWEQVLNRKGMTWRRLDEAERAKIVDDETAIALMLEKPSIIKRPILADTQPRLLGFDADSYKETLAS